MAKEQSKLSAGYPWPLIAAVLVALLLNGLAWSVRFPPLHPNDEGQHYLYATRFDGSGAGAKRKPGQVPRDLQAFGEMVDFGPHREKRQEIDFSSERAYAFAALIDEADNPANALVFVPDSETDFIIGHSSFEDYHPPVYYSVLGQCLRLGHALGLGVRGRILLARMLSIGLGLLAAWLAMLLARVIWPRDWGMPALIGLAMGWQVIVAFYTSVLNNDVFAFPLLTGFLLLSASIVQQGPTPRRVLLLILFGVVLLATKLTMLIVVPVAIVTLLMSAKKKWLRGGALTALLFGVGLTFAWLLIPLGGGGTVTEDYLGDEVPFRAFPAEMFSRERVLAHVRTHLLMWGRSVGNALTTDAGVDERLYKAMVPFAGLVLLLSLVRLFFEPRDRRRLLILLLVPQVAMAGLLYAIDYRFESQSESRFFIRPQYYFPAAASMMILFVMGLLGWLRGRMLALGVALFLLAVGGFNLFFLHDLVAVRYFGYSGWWGACERAAMIWPVPTWLVAGVDVLSVISGLAAYVAVVRAVYRGQLAAEHASASH